MLERLTRIEQRLESLSQVDRRSSEAVNPAPSTYISNVALQAELGVSKATLYRWRSEHKLPSKEVGQKIFYRRDEVEAFLEARRSPRGL